MRTRTGWRILITGACVLIAGLWLWSRHLPAKARDLDPVIQELAEFKAKTGVFPLDAQTLTSVHGLATRRTLYYGDRQGTNLFWDPFEVSAHELTILTLTNEFTLYAPVGRIKLFSFSSFPVWRYDSASMNWARGRIHWSLLGTYWDDE